MGTKMFEIHRNTRLSFGADLLFFSGKALPTTAWVILDTNCGFKPWQTELNAKLFTVILSSYSASHDARVLVALRKAYPLVNVYKKLRKITIFNGKTHYKWPFSIAMLVYQRVKMMMHVLKKGNSAERVRKMMLSKFKQIVVRQSSHWVSTQLDGTKHVW